MEGLEEKIRDVLTARFPGAELEYEEPYDEKLGGFLIWDGFEEEEIIDRLTQVWDTLRAHFHQDDLRRISFIFAVTPDELLAMRED